VRVDYSSVETDPAPYRPCFMIRFDWNIGLDGHQPQCGGPDSWRAVPLTRVGPAPGVLRPRLDDRP
jgi:hypothetical protein